MTQNNKIHHNLIKDDGYYLSDDGVRVLASNMRKCVENVLGIDPPSRFAKGAEGDDIGYQRRRPNRQQSRNRLPGDQYSVDSDSPDRGGYRRRYSPEHYSSRPRSFHFEGQRWERRDR